MSEPDGSPPASTTSVVPRLLALAWQYKLDCIGALLIQALLVGLSIAGLGVSGLAIDVIRHALDANAPAPRWPFGLHVPMHWSSMRLVLTAGLVVLGLALLRAVLSFVYGITTGHLVQVKIVPALREAVYAKLQRMSFRFFDATASGAIINRVTGDVQNVRAFVDQVLLQGLALTLGLALSVVYMAKKHWGLTFACVASAPLVALTSLRFSSRARPAYERSRDLLDRVVTVIAESVQGIAVVKGFARESERKKVFEDRNQELRSQQQSLFKAVAIFAPTTDFLSHLNLVVLLAYGGHLVMTNQVSLGDAIVFAGLLQQYAASVANVSNIVNSLQQSLISARRVFEILDAPVGVRAPTQGARPAPFSPQIELRDVSFGYGPAGEALRGINLVVATGTTVVLFGATGSGKSTLLSLLPRFYDVTQGQVLISGTDVRDFDLVYLRERIGFMFQESVLFSTTVADNIAFGSPAASQADIEAAATLAAAHGFVSRLPGAYEAYLEEGGRNLSGGERQRLALARALLPDPAILLLDDPTAALDNTTEAEVIAALHRAKQGRTTIVATHRLPLCQIADEIVVLERGQIVERGTHATLMQSQGAYARAARAHKTTPSAPGPLVRVPA
ncbi:MAG: ABC transporter ATP-binding protein [Deltaproteobacteria bacterium]|nr:ABC transporter ATP-binding protein [Deltaproteobacteria bacterium]